MSVFNVINLECPGCGAPVTTSEKMCKYCGREVIISTFSSVYSISPQDANKYVRSYKKALNKSPNDPKINYAIGICYLKLKLYDQALRSFEQSIEEDFDNSEAYFYASISLLKGKKAFVNPIKNIRKAEEYLNAASAIENRGIYNYFLAYIKYDFYQRKFLNVVPNYNQELEQAISNNVTQADIKFLFELLNVQKPKVL